MDEKTKRKRTKRKYSLPATSIGFDKELNILKALVEYSEKGNQPVMYKDIKGVAHETIVSSELSFFSDAGLAKKEKGSKYLPTKDVIDLINNLNWDDEERAKKILNKILANSWFGDLAIKILKVSGEKSADDLIKELGKEAEGDPEKDRKSIAKLIDWLKYAEIIEIGDEDIVRLKGNPQIEEEIIHKESSKESAKREVREAPTDREIRMFEGKELSINLIINLQISSDTDVGKIQEIVKIIKQEFSIGVNKDEQ